MASHNFRGFHDEIQIQIQGLDSLGRANDQQIQASLEIRTFITKDLDAARHQARPHSCNAAGASRRYDRCNHDGHAAAPAEGPELRRPKSRNYGCGAVQLRAQSPAAGNGIFGCRDRAPKSPLKCANVGRDQNPGSEWPEIPAETPYSESYRKRAVCEDCPRVHMFAKSRHRGEVAAFVLHWRDPSPM